MLDAAQTVYVALQVLATLPAEGRSLNDLHDELSTIASNYEKMQETYPPVSMRWLTMEALLTTSAGAQVMLQTLVLPSISPIQLASDNPGLSNLQSEKIGPWAAYVDNPDEFQGHLKKLFPSLQHVIADITHVMRRFSETLTPHHPLIGEYESVGGGTAVSQTFRRFTYTSSHHTSHASLLQLL